MPTPLFSFLLLCVCTFPLLTHALNSFTQLSYPITHLLNSPRTSPLLTRTPFFLLQDDGGKELDTILASSLQQLESVRAFYEKKMQQHVRSRETKRKSIITQRQSPVELQPSSPPHLLTNLIAAHVSYFETAIVLLILY